MSTYVVLVFLLDDVLVSCRTYIYQRFTTLRYSLTSYIVSCLCIPGSIVAESALGSRVQSLILEVCSSGLTSSGTPTLISTKRPGLPFSSFGTFQSRRSMPYLFRDGEADKPIAHLR